MAVTINVAPGFNLHTETYACSEDLSALQYCAVNFESSATAGSKTRIAKPTGQGTMSVGILQNAPVYGTDRGDVRHQGTSKAKTHSTFNKGIELTVHDSNGKLEAAASGDYVIAFSSEPSTCADALVMVLLTGPYQKN